MRRLRLRENPRRPPLRRRRRRRPRPPRPRRRSPPRSLTPPSPSRSRSMHASLFSPCPPPHALAGFLGASAQALVGLSLHLGRHGHDLAASGHHLLRQRPLQGDRRQRPGPHGRRHSLGAGLQHGHRLHDHVGRRLARLLGLHRPHRRHWTQGHSGLPYPSPSAAHLLRYWVSS